MEKLKRFEITAYVNHEGDGSIWPATEVAEVPDGEWVKFEDVEKLIAELMQVLVMDPGSS